MKLKRELGLASTTLYGIGVILGAGIYALIAVGAGLAGNMLWLAFLIGAAIAVFTALSYAELSSMFPQEAAEYNYTRKAFNREWLSFSVGWVLAIGTVVAAATVALGFGGYFSSLTGMDVKLSALGLIIAMSALNYLGIKESATFNTVSTLIEIAGLIIVIAAAFFSTPAVPADLLEAPPGGLGGILAAVSVIFFAYIGFENLANLSEEVKDSRKNVPKALVLGLGISTVLYMLVAIAAVREVGWAALSGSQAPLTLVVSRALGQYAPLLSYIALFATANTVLMFLIAPSRMLYGMSKGGSLQRAFSIVGGRGTPFVSVAAVGLAAAALTYWSDIKTVAQLTDLGVFVAYFAVNAALVALAWRASSNGARKASNSHFKSPRMAGIPVFAVAGALSSIMMLAVFPSWLWAVEAVILAVGAALFLGRKRSFID